MTNIPALICRPSNKAIDTKFRKGTDLELGPIDFISRNKGHKMQFTFCFLCIVLRYTQNIAPVGSCHATILFY